MIVQMNNLRMRAEAEVKKLLGQLQVARGIYPTPHT